MARESLYFLVIAFVLFLGGCSAPIKVEPLTFSHEDEVIRESEFIVLADRRVFTVMAFMNACGYDEERKGMQMHPARSRVREILKEQAATHPEHFKKWWANVKDLLVNEPRTVKCQKIYPLKLGG